MRGTRQYGYGVGGDVQFLESRFRRVYNPGVGHGDGCVSALGSTFDEEIGECKRVLDEIGRAVLGRIEEELGVPEGSITGMVDFGGYVRGEYMEDEGVVKSIKGEEEGGGEWCFKQALINPQF